MLRLDDGEVFGEVRRLNSASRFDIATSVDTAGIRGTVFQVRIEKAGPMWTMTIINADGGIEARSEPLDIEPQALDAGDMLVIRADETGGLHVVELEQYDLPEGVISALIEAAKAPSSEVDEDAGNSPAETQATPAARSTPSRQNEISTPGGGR